MRRGDDVWYRRLPGGHHRRGTAVEYCGSVDVHHLDNDRSIDSCDSCSNNSQKNINNKCCTNNSKYTDNEDNNNNTPDNFINDDDEYHSKTLNYRIHESDNEVKIAASKVLRDGDDHDNTARDDDTEAEQDVSTENDNTAAV